MAILLAAAEASNPLPGPGPWGPRAWCGAALYVALFGAALWGVWVLIRTQGEEARP